MKKHRADLFWKRIAACIDGLIIRSGEPETGAPFGSSNGGPRILRCADDEHPLKEAREGQVRYHLLLLGEFNLHVWGILFRVARQITAYVRV